MKFDFQDALLLAGIALVVGGVAVWSRPGASVLLGAFCLLAVVAIERGKRKKGPDGPSHS